jgi:hypothetical protein
MRRLKPGLANAARSFPVITVEEELWSGDRLSFRVRALGQVASGTVDAAEDHVRLEVSLPGFIARFADRIKSVIAAKGKLMIQNGPGSKVGEP